MHTPQPTAPIRGLAELTSAWSVAKAQENGAKKARLAIETEILALQEVTTHLKSKGTTNFGPLKIVTDFNRIWNQAKLAAAQRIVPADFWPFNVEFKEVGDGSKYLIERQPEIWKLIVPALTLKPKKPSFSVKEAK